MRPPLYGGRAARALPGGASCCFGRVASAPLWGRSGGARSLLLLVGEVVVLVVVSFLKCVGVFLTECVGAVTVY